MPSHRLPIGRKLIALVSVGFLALIVAALAMVWLQRENQRESEGVEHTLNVQFTLARLQTLVERVETARRGYILSRDDRFYRTYIDAARPVPVVAAEFRGLVRDNPLQDRRAAEVSRLLARQRELQLESIGAVRRGGRDLVIARFADDPAVAVTREVRELMNQMRDEENRLLAARSAEQRRTLNIFYLLLSGVGLLLIAVAATTLMVMNRYTRELAASRDQLRRLNEGLEGIVSERTRELQRANQEIQRFAYIVSHDLRSPLVNVMGFTAELETARKTATRFLEGVEQAAPDLVGADARQTLREDLPEAIDFIRSSTQKMDRLINAILRLSREGRRTLTPERLDMNALAQTIADSLHQRLVEAGAEILVEPLPMIVNDRVAIEQILSNLVENAIKYLAPGRPGLVQLRGREERERVVIEVIDNGRGIDPRDHERIFDLFRRSGAQDRPGEGIGLAHVRALAYRLGGTIDVSSELDRGATFRLSLPRVLDLGNVEND